MKPASLEQLEPIWDALSARTGIRLPGARLDAQNPLCGKLLSRVHAVGMAQLLDDLDQEPPLFDELLDELTVRETYFFRDAAQFEFIRSHILPELLARRGTEHMVNCWSAACASGEEAYSIAILMREAGLSDRSRIVGSDISLDALARARSGKYRGWSLRGPGAALARRYLSSAGEHHVIDDSIRQRVTFIRLNLAQNVNPALSGCIRDMDLILCRNVLIYFDPTTIAAVARRLFDSLAEGGWLLTGASDPSLAGYAPFDVVVGDAGIAYRRPLRQPISLTRPGPEKPAPPEVRIRIRASKAAAVSDAPTDRCRADPVSNASPDRLAAARAAFDMADYARTVALTRDLNDLPAACVLRLRALANLGDAQAVAFADRAIELHPLCAELYYLLASVQIIAGDSTRAIALLRKAIYLTPSLAIAHFTLASLLRGFGDLAGARRSLRNATALAENQPEGEIVLPNDAPPAALPAIARHGAKLN
jgi:chemotaxis protein methyltransferase CheR